MKTYILILISALFFLYSCNEEELLMNQNKTSYLYFSKDISKDSTLTSFFFYIHDTIEIPVGLKISGRVPDQDVEYALSVDTGTTLDAACYKLPDELIWKANRTEDSVYITFINAPALATKRFTLVLNVVENKNFLPGEKVYSQAKISITAQPARPSWWEKDSRLEVNYLGAFTVKKYETFLIATKGADLTDDVKDNANTNWDRVRKCALLLKKYIAEWNSEHPNDILMDEDDKPMSVPVVG